MRMYARRPSFLLPPPRGEQCEDEKVSPPLAPSLPRSAVMRYVSIHPSSRISHMAEKLPIFSNYSLLFLSLSRSLSAPSANKKQEREEATLMPRLEFGVSFCKPQIWEGTAAPPPRRPPPLTRSSAPSWESGTFEERACSRARPLSSPRTSLRKNERTNEGRKMDKSFARPTKTPPPLAPGHRGHGGTAARRRAKVRVQVREKVSMLPSSIRRSRSVAVPFSSNEPRGDGCGRSNLRCCRQFPS